MEIIHRNLSKMKNKILSSCLLGNYKECLGEFRNTSYGVFGAEREKTIPYHFLTSITWGSGAEQRAS